MKLLPSSSALLLLLLLLCTILLSTSACSGNKDLKSPSAMNSDMVQQSDNGKDSVKKLTPVGPPTYAPGMVGVQGSISSVKRSGGEVIFELKVQRILGSGAAAKKPAIGETMSLSYPEGPKTSASAKLIQNDAIIKLTLSSLPSITEGGEQWVCEKVHLEN
jgi:hypothetical protein